MITAASCGVHLQQKKWQDRRCPAPIYKKKIEGMEDLNYRERLASLHLYSQERRRDRYMVILVWKVAMGLIDGYDLKFKGEQSRRGREVILADVVRSSPACVRKARTNSLSVKGGQMFNLMPADLRNLTSDKVTVFKAKLDSFLKSIPDQPTIAEEGRVAQTNCLLNQIPPARINIINM